MDARSQCEASCHDGIPRAANVRSWRQIAPDRDGRPMHHFRAVGRSLRASILVEFERSLSADHDTGALSSAVTYASFTLSGGGRLAVRAAIICTTSKPCLRSSVSVMLKHSGACRGFRLQLFPWNQRPSSLPFLRLRLHKALWNNPVLDSPKSHGGWAFDEPQRAPSVIGHLEPRDVGRRIRGQNVAVVAATNRDNSHQRKRHDREKSL